MVQERIFLREGEVLFQVEKGILAFQKNPTSALNGSPTKTPVVV